MKWFQVDFNDLDRMIIFSKADYPYKRCHWHSRHDIPKEDEIFMIYTMDDYPPFGFEAKSNGVLEREDCYIMYSKELDGSPRYEFIPMAEE